MIKRFSGGLLDSNTYVIYCSESKNAVIVDCGCDVNQISEYVNEHSLTVKYIVLTHAHYDHAEYTEDYLKAFPNALLVCHEDEKQILSDPDGNLSPFFGVAKKYPLPHLTVKDGDKLELSEDMIFKVIHAPGHTPGCICLLDEKQKLMITGDVLFANSYGRVDFKYGDPAKMAESLKRILSLDPDITFFPGHYGHSRIGSWRI